MVFVLVGEEDAVQVADALPQHLHAEIGPGVDEDDLPAVADQGRCPEALVARVLRAADFTAAADDGHALRGARPQKSEAGCTHKIMSSKVLMRVVS